MKKRMCMVVMILMIVMTIGYAKGAQESKEATPKVITIWHSFTQPDRAAFIQNIANEYTAQNPNVTFQIEIYPWNTFDAKWKTAVSTGALPDISTALPEHVVMMNEAGLLAPMNDFISSNDYKFIEKPLKIMTVDNKILAIPFYVHARVLWMREDILKKYGLAEPKTMSELLQVATEITNRGEYYGMGVPMKKTDFWGTINLNIWIKALGGNIIKEDGKVDLTSPEAIGAINYLMEMYKNASPQGSINYGDPESNDSFIQGKTAFMFETGFLINRVLSGNPSIAPGVKAILPVKGDKTGLSGWFADYVNFVVWKGENEQIAKDFLKEFFREDEYYKFLHLVPGGMIPSIEGVVDSEQFMNNQIIKERIEDIRIIQQGVAEGTPIGADFGIVPSMNIVKSMGMIEEMLQIIALGQMDVASAAKMTEEKINNIIETSLNR